MDNWFIINELKERNENQAKIIQAQGREIERLYKELAKSSDERLTEANRTIINLMAQKISREIEETLIHGSASIPST